MKSESDEKIVSFMPGHKVGVKYLNENQLAAVFPDVESLRNKIETHRQFIRLFWNERGKEKHPSGRWDDQYNIMFDNVYSILGSRGSGKTSVVYTLKKLFSERNEKDIVLPIIMSELIPESCEIIGWILSLMEEVVQELQKNLNDIQKKSDDFWTGCSSNKNKDNLLNDFETVKELCFSKKYNEGNAESFSTAVIGSERSTQNSFDFSRQLTAFWTKLKNSVKKVNGMGENKEPLIYIIFDDVDLAPEKIWELLSTIVKYLSHPNVIVLMTAEEEMLYKVVRNILRIKTKSKKDDIQTMEWINKTTKLYVGKILPPATRYYIESFDTCAKKKKFESLQFRDGRIFTDFLKDFLVKCVDEHILDMEPKVSDRNFLFYDKDKFIDAYFLFWGHTSRQLENERLIMEELFQNLKELQGVGEQEEYLLRLYHIVYSFVFSTLHTNSRFHDLNAKEWADGLLKYRSEDWGVYVNYAYLQEHFLAVYDTGIDLEEGLEREARINMIMDTVKENIAIYVMLFFVENILLIEYDKRKELVKQKRAKVHGKAYLVEMLDMIMHDNDSLVCGSDVGDYMQDFLYTYGGILEQPEILLKFDIKSAKTVREYFYALPKETDIKKGEALARYSKANPKWFETMTKLLYMSNRGLYNLTPATMRELEINRRQKLYDETLQNIEHDMLSNIARHISENISEGKLDKPGKEIEINQGESDTKKIYGVVRRSAVQDCLATVDKYDKQLCNKIFLLFKQKKYTDLLEEIKNEINILYVRFEKYNVANSEEFKQCIKISCDMANLQFDLTMLQYDNKHNKYTIPIAYMNAYMERLLQNSFDVTGSNHSEYVFDDDDYILRKERLQYYYERIKNSLSVELIVQEDKECMLKLLVLRRLYNYAGIQYIQGDMKKEKKKDFKILDIGRIPYVSFTGQINKILETKNTKQKSYVDSLIKEYIKEGVSDYIEYIYNRRLE